MTEVYPATALPSPVYAPDAPTGAPPAQQMQRLDARALTGPTGQVQLVLDDKTYILRITRTSKLILTK